MTNHWSRPGRLSLLAVCAAAFGCMAFFGSSAKKGIDPRDAADMLHAVISSDRTVYTKLVVNRLTLQDKVITASEHFADENALPLPAQILRFGAELVSEKTDKFTYSLQSLWAINKQNSPRTDVEKHGLEQVAADGAKNFYAEEALGGKTYLTAVYADVAVVEACAGCHNNHKDSPRKNFKPGDVMGGVVIRIPMPE